MATMMQRYTYKEFKTIVANADIIYGQCKLNAAVRVNCRIRKKTLLQELDNMDKNSDAVQLGMYAESLTDKKGRKILKIV